MTDRLGRLLLVTLEAARVDADLPVPREALRSWLDSWRGIGAVERGMARQGYDLQLTRYDDKGWRATFYTTGMEHSPTGATGTGWERTPWHATQRAAWEALRKAERRTAGESTNALDSRVGLVIGYCISRGWSYSACPADGAPSATFLVVVAFDVSGTATAMIVWIGIKMAAGWNVSQPRAATIFTALGGLMSMFFALTGGLICRPPH